MKNSQSNTSRDPFLHSTHWIVMTTFELMTPELEEARTELYTIGGFKIVIILN